VFAAVLSIWAYITHLPEDNRSTEQLEAFNEIKDFLGPVTGTSDSTGRRVLKRGADLLARVEAWRIGSAFALVLLKEAERVSR
jgi:hypothetical protein